MKKTGLIYLSFTFLCTSLYPMTMDEAVGLAMENHQQILERKQLVEQRKVEIESARSTFFPSLDLSYGYTNSNQENTLGDKERSFATATVSYTLFNGLKDSLSLDSSEASYIAETYQLRARQEDIALHTKIAFINVLETLEAINVAEEDLSLLTSQKEDTERFFEQGMIAKNELLEVEVNLAQRELNLLQSQSDFNVAKENLVRLIGVPLKTNETFENPSHSLELASDSSSLESRMLKSRSEILYLQKLIEIQNYNTDIIQGNYYPSVTVSGNGNVYGDNLVPNGRDGTYDDEANVDLSLAWNVFSGFKDKSDMQASKIAAKQLNSQLIDLQRDLKLQLFTALEKYRLAKAQRKVTEKALIQAEENYRIVNNRFKQQLDTSTDLLDAELLLTRSKTNNNKAFFAIQEAIAEVERITESDQLLGISN